MQVIIIFIRQILNYELTLLVVDKLQAHHFVILWGKTFIIKDNYIKGTFLVDKIKMFGMFGDKL